MRFHPISTVDLEEEGREDNEDTDDGNGGEGVVEDYAGEDNGEDLSDRHDDDKDDWPEGADGVVDEELPH